MAFFFFFSPVRYRKFTVSLASLPVQRHLVLILARGTCGPAVPFLSHGRTFFRSLPERTDPFCRRSGRFIGTPAIRIFHWTYRYSCHTSFTAHKYSLLRLTEVTACSRFSLGSIFISPDFAIYVRNPPRIDSYRRDCQFDRVEFHRAVNCCRDLYKY